MIDDCSEIEEKLQKTKKSLKYAQYYDVKLYDSLSDRSTSPDVDIKFSNILLVLNDCLHDAVDKGDKISINVLRSRSKCNDIHKALFNLIKGRVHWIKDYNKLKELRDYIDQLINKGVMDLFSNSEDLELEEIN